MFGSSISRWTMLHFAAALIAFVLAQIVIVAGLAYPTVPLLAPTTLVAVHLLVIGWLTVLMLGALHQFVPVITASPKTLGHSALASWLMIEIGLVLMAVGFLALGGMLPGDLASALPLGGLIVLGGVAFAALPLAAILIGVRPMTLPARFVLAGLAFLVATVALGLVFGAILAFPATLPWGRFLAGAVRVHLSGGLIGWFSLTALGVGYRLLGMFMLAPEERGRLGMAAFVFTTCGLGVAWLSGLVESAGIEQAGPITVAGEIATGVGVALYLLDMVRLYRSRRRRALELNSRAGAVALAMLGAASVLIVGLALAGRLAAFAGPVGYLFVFGWLSGLGLSQLYKIVPFLTWVERYGSMLGKGRVPRVQDLVDEARAQPWFAIYFFAVAAGTAFGLLGWAGPWRVAVLAHLIATLGLARELWRARYCAPHQAIGPSPARSVTPSPESPGTVQSGSTQQGVLS